MLRLQCVNSSLRRLFYSGTVNRDLVLEQLRVCCNEDHVFAVVGKNKAKLTVDHVSQAAEMLWKFQKEKPEWLRTADFIKSHPQFLTLRVLAENKIVLMDDSMLVDTLYNFLRLTMDPHDSLIQQLVSEAWLRLAKLPMTSLSKFSICLFDQHLFHSPLMGQITDILAQRLSTIDDARILTTLMISVSSLVSLRLRDAIIARIDHLLDTADPTNYNNPRRVIQFLRNIKHSHRPLIEKCNRILLRNMPRMNAGDISIILGFYQLLHFNNCDFRLAAKQRLTELIDSSTDPFSFTTLFVTLSPLANPGVREGLENTALLLVHEFNAHQAMAVAEALEDIQSRNLSLINKIAAIIQRNLHVYKPVEVARITQALVLLQYQNPELYSMLRMILIKFLRDSVFPCEVTMLTRVLSMLPFSHVDESLIARIKAVAPQCNLADLNAIAQAVAKWVHHDPSYHHNTPSKYVRLLQALTRHGQERLRTADRLDLLLEDLKYVSGVWFDEMLTEDTMVTLKRMMNQINWANVPELGMFLTKIFHLSPPLMDHIASVVVKDINKLHYSVIYATLLPFSVLNYDSIKVEHMYDACIQHFTPQICLFDPHLLVFMGYYLAVADFFPEEVIKEIFNIEFLGKLDSQLEILPDVINMRVRLRLMELNRAVCLECPEYQVPWFHERYCQRLQQKGSGTVSTVQKQIHKMLGEILGGINYVRAAVVTPYFYTVDFECILDKELKPLPYIEQSSLQIPDRGQVQWGSESLSNVRDELPPGAQRVAVDFLNAKSFCKNSSHMKGEALMRKRHLEILGYCVVQIPHFEWNSMELSSQDAWKDYLKKKIFGECSV